MKRLGCNNNNKLDIDVHARFSMRALIVALVAVVWAGVCADAEPFVLLQKSVLSQQGVYAESMDVVVRAFNTGESPAYSVSLKDADWPASHFEVVKGAKELTLPVLEAKANASLRCAAEARTPAPSYSPPFRHSCP